MSTPPWTPTNVQGIDHIQLPMPVRSATAARAFYQDLLDLAEVRHPRLDRPGILRFAFGWQRLDLSEGRCTGVAPRAHVALRVRNLRSPTRRLHAAGLRIDTAPLADCQERVCVEDPFGNRLDLIESPSSVLNESKGIQRASDLRFSI